jgi:hypothetical protein
VEERAHGFHALVGWHLEVYADVARLPPLDVPLLVLECAGERALYDNAAALYFKTD